MRDLRSDSVLRTFPSSPCLCSLCSAFSSVRRSKAVCLSPCVYMYVCLCLCVNFSMTMPRTVPRGHFPRVIPHEHSPDISFGYPPPENPHKYFLQDNRTTNICLWTIQSRKSLQKILPENFSRTFSTSDKSSEEFPGHSPRAVSQLPSECHSPWIAC